MIKVAFFDIDGTLLSHNTRVVSESTRLALKKLKEKGIKCVIASGRHIAQLQFLDIRDLEFDGYLTLNGMICLDENKQVLCGFPIAGRAKERLVQMFRDKQQPVLLVEDNTLYMNKIDDRVRYVQDCISSPCSEIGQYSGRELYMGVLYISQEEMGLVEDLQEDLAITRWNPYAIDMIAKGGGKDQSIRRYLEEWGLTREECIAFGDGENDMGMLEFAGIGVAMGNAEACVKAVADYVTDDVDADGIYNALKHFGIIA